MNYIPRTIIVFSLAISFGCSRGLPVGKWEGHVEQPNSKGYSVTMRLENLQEGASGGSVIYPELNCRGTLRLLEMRDDKLIFAEKIESGRCVDGGNIEIRLAQDNKLIWQWFYPNGTRGAYATLIRIDAKTNFNSLIESLIEEMSRRTKDLRQLLQGV